VNERVRRLRTTDAGFEAAFARLRHWSAETDAGIEAAVAAIVEDVRRRGDAALLEHTARFDGLDVASAAALEVPRAELAAAFAALPTADREALQQAAERIRHYHERQRDANARGFAYTEADGTRLGQKVTPLARVGLYVPGGKAAYPSSVLMNAVPAQVAGVGEIVMVVPAPRGEKNALVLAAAHLAGVHRVFTIGGAQAVAALAWGTATVPAVDKITGPGNAYVAAAKRRVFGQVGIDMVAGPSEVLVIADGSVPAEWVAMDLFSQAEHDEHAQAVLLTPDEACLAAVAEAIDRLLPSMPRRAVIEASLAGRGALVLTRSMEEAIQIANRLAPEHLELCVREPHRWEPLIHHAGAIFLGGHTSESLGDYCAGPDHVLPTAGTARFSSPLSVLDFVKRTSLVEVSAAGARTLGRVASVLARGEGLVAHARAAELRVEATVVDAAPERAVDTAPERAVGPAIDLRAITSDNIDAVMKLAVAPAQAKFVADVPRSIAQASVRPFAARALAAFEGEVPVGFLLLWDMRHDPDEPADELYVWRLLVDQHHQRRGIGRAIVAWVVSEARRLGVAHVGLSHVTGNHEAGAFYERLGFAYTGRVEDGEREMRKVLR
jgi:histidinol dehydrogenase